MKSLLAVLLVSFGLSAFPQDLNSIIGSLSGAANDLNGLKITAWQTNVTFNQKSIILENIRTNNSLSSNTIEALNDIAKTLTDNETNVFLYVYRFSSNVCSVSYNQYSCAGKIMDSAETYATQDEIWEYHKTVSVGKNGETNMGGWAEIHSREPSMPFGVPPFLSISTIYGQIANSSKVELEFEQLESGDECCVLVMPGIPNAPTARRKLWLSKSTLLPVRYGSFLKNGSEYSHTELHFGEIKGHPRICARAIAQNPGYMQSVWQLESIAVDNDAWPTNFASIIPVGTRVMDRRQSVKKLDYRMGLRLPNENEIKMMLTNKFGVARYEAANYHPSNQDSGVLAQRKRWIRGILFVVLSVPLLGLLLFKFFAKK